MVNTENNATLLEDIAIASGSALNALNASGYNVEMNEGAFKELDRFFQEQMDDVIHQPLPGGILADETGKRLFMLATLIGDIAIYRFGGVWLTDDNDPQGDMNIAVRLNNGNTLKPVYLLLRRMQDGPTINIQQIVSSAGAARVNKSALDIE